MSKKDKKVVNSGISGAAQVVVDPADIVVEETKVAKIKPIPSLAIHEEDDCIFSAGERSIHALPKLTIGGKEIPLAPATADQVAGVRLHNLNYYATAPRPQGRYSKEEFDRFSKRFRIGKPEEAFFAAKVGDRLFLLTAGSIVTLRECWGQSPKSVFIGSVVEVDSLSGNGELVAVNSSIHGKSVYISDGTFKVRHSSIHCDDITVRDGSRVKGCYLSCRQRCSLIAAVVESVTMTGWNDIRISLAAVNKFGSRDVDISSVRSGSRSGCDLTIRNVNIGEIDVPNRILARDTDICISHRSHIGFMPGINSVEFLQTDNCEILLGGELTLSLEDLEAMRYRIPTPEAPTAQFGGCYQPTPWLAPVVNKDGEADKYDRLVRIFVSGVPFDKQPRDIDQLLGLQFRPFYDAIVSRVKLFRLLKALG